MLTINNTTEAALHTQQKSIWKQSTCDLVSKLCEPPGAYPNQSTSEVMSLAMFICSI